MCLAVGLLLAPAAAQAPGPWLVPTTTQAAPAATPNPAAVQSRLVEIDVARLRAFLEAGTPGDAFTIEPLPGTALTFRHQGVDAAADGIVWRGSIPSLPEASAFVSIVGDAVCASLRVDTRLWEIVPAGNGVHRVSSILESAMDPCGTTTAHEVYAPSVPGGPSPRGGNPDIDVLVAYTTAAKNGLGGTAGIQARINLAISETNSAYTACNMGQRLNLVHSEEMIGYVEPGSMSTMLSDIRGTNDGRMDNVHALRNQYGADCVVLINQNGSYCGIAYLMTNVSPGFAGSAFSVVKSSCATGYYSFGHELGHNMGCAHDPQNAGSAAYSFSYGYRTPNSLYRTVMAYSPGTRVLRFSSPNVQWAGYPMGTASQDNARSMDLTSSTVAGWRTPPVTTPVLATPSLWSGFSALLSVTDCTPGGTVFFAYSAAGGGPTATPYGVVSLSAPYAVAASAVADANGDVSILVPVPSGTSGATVWLQALDQGSGDLSNGVSSVIL